METQATFEENTKAKIVYTSLKTVTDHHLLKESKATKIDAIKSTAKRGLNSY